MISNSLSPYRNAGFTLIEILVALAVIAIAVAAVMAAISGNVSNAAYIQDRTLAHWVAMNKIAEMQVAKDWPAAGTQQGESLMASQEWSWKLTVSTTDDPDVRRLDVAVYVNQNQKTPLSAMVAYMGRSPTTSTITGGQSPP